MCQSFFIFLFVYPFRFYFIKKTTYLYVAKVQFIKLNFANVVRRIAFCSHVFRRFCAAATPPYKLPNAANAKRKKNRYSFDGVAVCLFLSVFINFFARCSLLIVLLSFWLSASGLRLLCSLSQDI